MTWAVELTALAAAALMISWLWRPRQAMEPGIGILLFFYAVLGAWALWFGLYSAPGREPAAFLFWKPTVLYWMLSAVLIVAPALGWGYPVKAIVGTYFVFSNREWRWINLGFAVLCALLGGLNLVIAFGYSKDDWDGFKWSCMVNLVALFMLRLTFVWLDTMVRFAMYVHARAKAYFQ
jgi:intracellular septation protein